MFIFLSFFACVLILKLIIFVMIGYSKLIIMTNFLLNKDIIKIDRDHDFFWYHGVVLCAVLSEAVIFCTFLLGLGVYSALAVRPPKFYHIDSLSSYPSTGYTLSSEGFLSIIWSTVSLNASFIILGINLLNNVLEHSMHGFSLT